MDGILLIDKPKGWTSFDAVAKVRGVVRRAYSQQSTANSQQPQKTRPRKVKVGHTGTLDPLATGLLVLLLGSYTKKAPELTKLDKTYEVTMTLGQTSTTGDEEGEKVAISKKQPAKSEVEAALQKFLGEIEQVPPAYSAVKINGQRAYKLARAGKEVTIEPRKVTIKSIKLSDYTYPIVKFTADVSSGTYIRTMVEDIGEYLGTGAYMSDLRRTRVGQFDVKNAISPEEITIETLEHSVNPLDK